MYRTIVEIGGVKSEYTWDDGTVTFHQGVSVELLRDMARQPNQLAVLDKYVDVPTNWDNGTTFYAWLNTVAGKRPDVVSGEVPPMDMLPPDVDA